ncbi:MAG: ATP synthase epsilon chain [Bacteroidetes bacterium ADurb.Bin408]|nr:MAG: ATP synthase epsilon chain [Bacteroidetes bacterium ADurb.Bin408]
MYLEIISPDNTLFTGNVSLIEVPGTKSRFTILNNHDAIISTLTKGKVRIIDEQNKTQFFDITGGVVEVMKNKIIILAD